MRYRSPRTILAASATLALTIAALTPTAGFAKGPGPGAGSCDGDCTATQQEATQQEATQQIRARDGSGSGAQTRAKTGSGTQTMAKAGGGAQVKASAGGGGKVQARTSNTRRQARTSSARRQVRAGTASAAGAELGGQLWRNRADDRPLGPEACDACQAEMGELDETQVSELLFMAREEKLAHDVYAALAELYDMPVFANVAEAEAQHQAAVDAILERYDIEDLTSTLPAGAYGDEDMEALYLEFVAQGSQSLEDAFAVGIAIESDDIAALEGVIAALGDDAPDVSQMYAHLLAGSQRHLEAFDRSTA